MHQIDKNWRRNKRGRQHSKRQCNNQLMGQTRGKQEAEALADKTRQCDKRASMDNARLADGEQQQQE
jgi:hypothetical protein